MKRLVLVGAGHAHAQVLLDWARTPLRGVELVVVSPQPLAPYSGMVPGWLAGHYRFDEIVIDFAALCAAAGATFRPLSMHALDPDARRLQLDDGQVLDWDLLSLDVGSTLRPPDGLGAARVLSMRPLARLRDRWEPLLDDWAAGRLDDAAGHGAVARAGDPAAAMAMAVADGYSGAGTGTGRGTGTGTGTGSPFRITAVGGGAAGIESLLAALARLRALRPGQPIDAVLASRAPTLLPGHGRRAVRAATAALQRAGVTLRLGTDALGWVAQRGGLLLWATGAQAHDWQRDPARRGALAVDGEGFVRIDARLRSRSHPLVHAAGDCAAWSTPLPKAGVIAVRMGPVLSRNLRAALGDGVPQDYRPQRRLLALLATGDGRAIASRGALAAEGRWVWRWKDHIDRGFIARYAMPAAGAGGAAGSPARPASRPMTTKE